MNKYDRVEPPHTFDSSTQRRRQVGFRIVAAGIPSLLGMVLIVFVLVQQRWLRLVDGRLQISRPPLYLQEPGHEITGHRYLYDEQLGWRNIPNWHATTRGHTLSINSQGLRGPESAYAKPTGVKRILILGDSYAWGYGVGDDDVFAVVLERHLAARTATLGIRWEVLNSGVSGWGTDQEYLFLTREGLRYDPDIVVVSFFLGNDFDNNAAVSQYELHKPVFVSHELELRNVPVPRPRDPPDLAAAAMVAKLDPVELTLSILRGVSETCTAHSCDLVVMKFGLFLAPDLPYAQQLAAKFQAAWDLAELKCGYLDLDRAFRERSLTNQQLLEGNDDGHWNASGHRQVAELLEAYLLDQGLLEEIANQVEEGYSKP